MSSSAITTQVAQLKIGNVQNQADSTSVYSAGVWSFKNSTALTSVTIDNSGNVGIGTASPGAKLEVTGETRIYPSSGAATMRFGSGGVEKGKLAVDASGNMLMETAGTERMRIDSFGSLCLTGATNGYAVTGGIYAPNVYTFTTASAANMFIESGGFFRRSTSSIKYKTDVQDNPHGLAEVMTLRPVTYKGKNDGNTIFGGLIAEEVHAAGLTEFVQYADDGSPDALAYGQMVSLAFKAIQELSAKNDALEARLAALEAK